MSRFGNLAGIFAAVVLMAGAAAAEPVHTVTLDIKPQPLDDAINAFAQQSGLQVVFYSGVGKDMISPRVVGTFATTAALDKLLANTSLAYEFIDARTVAIVARPPAGSATTKDTASVARPLMRVVSTSDLAQGADEGPGPVARNEAASGVESEVQDPAGAVPEILVKGQRSMNADIRRTEDGPQPYVIFDSEEIHRSQVTNIEDFLRTRLPMNATVGANNQVSGNASNNSTVNLRGLGTSQTLILVNGRRMPSLSRIGQMLQPDINGIPLSAIDRIEVLPSTAGGIYGGGATGGVINIVLRHDFTGMEVKGTYINTFDTDAGSTRLDASGGLSLHGGRTTVMISASRSEANNMVLGDRDFAERAWALQVANNPAAIGQFSPPLGATVNIRSISGNLVLDERYGSTPLNSNITHLPLGYVGPDSDRGAALVANAGRYNLRLSNDVNGRQRGLVSAPLVESAVLNLRHEFGSRLNAFLDISSFANKGHSFSGGVPNSVASMAADAPYNPFRQAIAVRFPTPGMSVEERSETTVLRATGGLIVRLPGNWTTEADYGWSRSRSQSIGTSTVIDTQGQNALNTGVGPPLPDTRPGLNALREGNTFPIDFTPYLLPSPNTFSGPLDTMMKNATLRFSGPTLNLPGGALTLSALLETRDESIEESIEERMDRNRALLYSFYPRRSRQADSYYMEAHLPLVSSRNALFLVNALELQASVRHDSYATRSDGSISYRILTPDGPFPVLNFSTNEEKSTNYTLGLRYAPVRDVALRASFGTGFLPPSISQIAPLSQTFNFAAGIRDPKRGDLDISSGQTYTILQNGNPDILPEQSRSFSTGLILTPRFLSGLRLSLDYTRIRKTDEIQAPQSAFLILNDTLFPGRVVRGGGRLSTDPAIWPDRISFINLTLINVARTEVDAYDLQADYTWRSAGYGEFSWYALATRQMHYRNQVMPNTAVFDRVGFNGGPLEWRGNTGLNWNRGPLTLGWNMQYYDDYRVYAVTATAAQINTARLNQGSTTIPRQMYHDFIATYRFDRATAFAAGALANSEISAGVSNVFDTSPPILAIADSILPTYSAYGDPRLRRYSISLRKNF